MSDKAFAKLNLLDQLLRRARPTGMRQEVDVIIMKRTGFELFNTRPYHNYETWSDGYDVFDREVCVSAEDLDEAVTAYVSFRAKLDAGEEIPTWCRTLPERLAKYFGDEPVPVVVTTEEHAHE